ncbi:MAG TPA: RES family NAD+ phosphorylase [Opitutaceae bacterium]|nr:RES family NAD+ phosphorylase [Opitutaceae bacterium]
MPPPSDLAERHIPTILLSELPVTIWHRIGKSKHPPAHYSTDAAWRFSRPDMPGTLYLGASAEICFWEVFWDDLATKPPAEHRIPHKKVMERSAWTATLPKPLSVVDILDPIGLQEMGAHGGTFRGPYSVCQDWAKALREHPEKPQGILYDSVRLAGGRCLALFAEYATDFPANFSDQTPLYTHAKLADLLEKHGFPALVRNDFIG